MTLESEVQQAVEELHAALKQLPDNRVCSLEDLYPDPEGESTSVSMYLLLIENEMEQYASLSMDEYQKRAYEALEACAMRLRKAGVRPPE